MNSKARGRAKGASKSSSKGRSSCPLIECQGGGGCVDNPDANFLVSHVFPPSLVSQGRRGELATSVRVALHARRNEVHQVLVSASRLGPDVIHRALLLWRMLIAIDAHALRFGPQLLALGSPFLRGVALLVEEFEVALSAREGRDNVSVDLLC